MRRTPSPTRRSIRAIIAAQSFGAITIQVLVNGGVLALLLIELGGSKTAVGAGFMANFLAQAARVISGRYVDVSDRKAMVVRWWLASSVVSATLLFPLFLVERIPETAAVWWVVGTFFVQQVALNIGGAAWHPWLGDIIPGRLQGRFFGNMRRVFQTSSLIVITAAGWYLGDDPTASRFIVVFALLIIGGFLRPLILLRVQRLPPTRGGPPERMLESLRRPLGDIEFRWFLLFWGANAFLVNVTRPFGVPFLRNDLLFPGSITIYASALLVLGMVVSLRPWGRTADRLGNRFVFLVNTVIMTSAFLLLAAVPGYPAAGWLAVLVAALSFLLTGVGLAGMGIAQIVRLMHAAPSDHRGPYMGLFFVTNGLVSAAASSLAGFVLDGLPKEIVLFGHTVLPIRIYFMVMAFALLFTAPMIRRLSRVRERGLREALSRIGGE